VLLLCGHFLEKYSRLGKTPMPALSKEVEQMLESYNWPGNVRELENVIERAVLLSRGETILPEHLYLEKEGERHRQPVEASLKSVAQENTTLREMEKRLIFKTLEKAEGNRTRASEVLGISVRTIRNKLNGYRKEAAVI